MRRRTRPHESPLDTLVAVVAAILWLVILLWLGPRALDMERANETHIEVTR